MMASGGTVGTLGERAVIERIRIRTPAPGAWVSVGIGDDAAVLIPERNRAEVITTDTLVEGVHFDRRYVPADAIGFKALAVNLSDLAAMGAEPRSALLSLVLPADLAVEDLDALVGGLLALAARYGVSLVGGNVARSPGPLIVDVTATGVVKPRRALTRRGARPGDDLYVSGGIGLAAAGLVLRRGGTTGAAAASGAAVEGGEGEQRPGPDEAACVERFLRPDPRMRLGALLGRNRVATACVDLSDGLADGLAQLAFASRVGLIVEGDEVPVPAIARRVLGADRRDADPLDAALAGGEDYELLFTVSRRRRRALAAVLRHVTDVACTRIGRVTADRRVVVRRQGADTPPPDGFAHFR